MEVPTNAIDCRKLIREGTYGRVYSGTLSSKVSNNNLNRLDGNDNESDIPILIKTVIGKQTHPINVNLK